MDWSQFTGVLLLNGEEVSVGDLPSLGQLCLSAAMNCRFEEDWTKLGIETVYSRKSINGIGRDASQWAWHVSCIGRRNRSFYLVGRYGVYDHEQVRYQLVFAN